MGAPLRSANRTRASLGLITARFGALLGLTVTGSSASASGSALPESGTSRPSRLFLYALILSLVVATLILVPAPRFAGASENTWVQMSPATSPAALYGASIAYDPATSQTVLFGGDTGSAYLDGTWTWNGTTWSQMSPATSPPASWDASMAYDTATGNLVLFGGYASTGFMNDTWTWNGTTWTQKSPATSPPVRYAASMAYDPATSQMVLFGGIGNDNYASLNDTWTWNGTTWTQKSPATIPATRFAASLAYDPATSQMVLFDGDDNDSAYLNDTWTWNGTTWSQLSPATSPSDRWGASIVYDQATSQLVLFGGDGSSSTYLNDTWTWNGTTWTELFPPTNPSGRWSASMAYDPATSQIVLFGGIVNGDEVGDTWAYEAANTYAVTYNGNGSTGGSVSVDPSSPYVAGVTVTVLANTGSLVRAGYTFSGWNTAANGTGYSYAASGTATFTMPGAGVTLYAQWTANTDTVNFASDGGSAVSSISGPDGSSITLPTDAYPGYSFDGWFTEASGGTEVGGAGSSYTIPSGGATLYAQWTANATDDYSYAANGGSGTAPASGSGLDGTSITLAANPFTYPGHTFTGWSDGTSTYAAGATYTLSSGGTPIVFTAQWSANQTDDYSYAANGGSGTAPASGSGLDGTSITLAANPFTYPGHTFTGWSDGTSTYGAGATYTLSSGGTPIVFTAQWTANQTDDYCYAANGGSGTAPASGSGLDGTTITLAANPFTYPGHTFTGWSDGTLTYPAGSSYLLSSAGAPIVFTAQWSANQTDDYSYAANGGTGTAPASGSRSRRHLHHAGRQPLHLPGPHLHRMERRHHDISGWRQLHPLERRRADHLHRPVERQCHRHRQLQLRGRQRGGIGERPRRQLDHLAGGAYLRPLHLRWLVQPPRAGAVR